MSAQFANLLSVAQVPHLDDVVLSGRHERSIRLGKVQRGNRRRMIRQRLRRTNDQPFKLARAGTRAGAGRTMNATSRGNSSCSDGKNAGPRRRRELLFGLPTALARTAPAAEVDAMVGEAMASLTPSTANDGVSWGRRGGDRRRTFILEFEVFLL